MDRPRLYVDFNEMVEENLVLLSKEDEKIDSSGRTVTLREGLVVHVYMDDTNEAGEADPLVGGGVVELNTAGGWTTAAKWSCRIDARGIRHLSDFQG
ncbi:MAG: hypothetical protein KTR31_05165 [Myxococcales bacterium]|nr:hypothetical protein [Myxococcales bacterium]